MCMYSQARQYHFAQVHEGRAETFRGTPEHADFWRFRKLFEQHRFGGIASLQICLFGIGDGNQFHALPSLSKLKLTEARKLHARPDLLFASEADPQLQATGPNKNMETRVIVMDMGRVFPIQKSGK